MMRRVAAIPSCNTSLRSFATSFPRMCYNYEAFRVATVREAAPEWNAKAVVKGAIQDMSFADFKGKYVVMLFYPLDFTFVCPTEIISFSDRHSEFEKINAQVLGVSIDSHFAHLAWTNTPRKKGGVGELNFPLVADTTKNISRDYGVLIEDSGISLRGLFIIDPKMNVRHITINDLPVGRSVDEVLRVLQAFQWSDSNPGQDLPCNWKPGSDPIVVAEAAKYFEKHN